MLPYLWPQRKDSKLVRALHLKAEVLFASAISKVTEDLTLHFEGCDTLTPAQYLKLENFTILVIAQVSCILVAQWQFHNCCHDATNL